MATAFEAYRYVVKHAKSWGGNADRIGIVGESAGGNLAIAMAIAARDQHITLPVAVVAVYPVTTTSMDTPSKKEEAAAKPLNTPMMAWFFDKLLNNAGEQPAIRASNYGRRRFEEPAADHRSSTPKSIPCGRMATC